MSLDSARNTTDVARYLQGKMAEDEATEFEVRCLTNEALQQELETAYQLKTGVEGLSEEDVDAILSNHDDNIAKIANKPVAWWERPMPFWQVAAVFVVLVAPLSFKYSFDEPSTKSPPGQLNVISFPVSSMRGGVASSIEIHQTGAPLVLSTFINPALTGGKLRTYSLDILASDSSTTKLALSNIHPTEQGMLYFNLGDAVFAPGDYTFALYQEREGQENALLKQGVITFN